jgi:hypothetical protein
MCAKANASQSVPRDTSRIDTVVSIVICRYCFGFSAESYLFGNLEGDMTVNGDEMTGK